MTPEITITIILILLFVGINLTANNRMITFILNNLFYGSNTNMALIRFFGVAVLSSIILILLKHYYYSLILNLLILILFTFFSIQGRVKVKRIVEQRRLERDAHHKALLDKRKAELVKTRAKKIKELEEMRSKPKSVKAMKKNMWDDGSMTNRDIIRDLNKD